MRMRHLGEIRSSARFFGSPWGWVAVALLSFVGCGGEPATSDTDVNVAVDSTQSVSSDQDDMDEVSRDAGSGTPKAARSNTEETAIPSEKEGIQMPDVNVGNGGQEVGAGGENPKDDVGPPKPGEGGLEMPDLDPAAQPADAGSDPGQGANAASGDVRLELASWEQIRSKATSGGRITVVDLWSTSCAPCIKEFPGLVRLSKSMPDAVRCIGVSVDYDGRKTKPADSYQPTVSAFLNAVGAEFENYLCNTPSDDVFTEVNLPSIPAVLIFDADGKMVKRFVDAGETIGFSYDKDVIPYIEKLAG